MPPAPTTFTLFLLSLLLCILDSLPVSSAQDAAAPAPYPTPSHPPPSPPPTPSPPPLSSAVPSAVSLPDPVPYPTPPIPSAANSSSLLSTPGDSLPPDITASLLNVTSARANATTTFHPLVPTPPSTMPDVRNATVMPNWVPNSTLSAPPTAAPPLPSSAPPIVPATTDPVVFGYPNASTSWTLERRHAHVTLSRPLDVAADLYLSNRNHTGTSRPYLGLLASAVPPGTLRVRFRTRGIANLPSGGGYVVFFADAAAAAGFEEVLVTSDPFVVLGRGVSPPPVAASMQDSGASTHTRVAVSVVAGFGIALFSLAVVAC